MQISSLKNKWELIWSSEIYQILVHSQMIRQWKLNNNLLDPIIRRQQSCKRRPNLKKKNKNRLEQNRTRDQKGAHNKYVTTTTPSVPSKCANNKVFMGTCES